MITTADDPMHRTSTVSGEHKTMLAMEVLHAVIVGIVVVAATVVFLINGQAVPGDLLGFVYGGAITYAGGRAAQVRGALTRQTDREPVDGG